MSEFERFRRDVEFMWSTAMGSWSTLMLVHGRLDREALAMLTLQMYHYVKNTPEIIEYALERLPAGENHEPYRRLLEYSLEEETGHDEVALADLARMGYDPDACRRTLPLPTTLNLHAANRLGVDVLGPYFILGETYATETAGADVSARIYESYRSHPSLSECVSFYEVHGEADVEHSRAAEACLRRYIGEPELHQPLVMGCLTAWRNLLLMAMELQTYRLYPSLFQLPTPRG